MCLYDRLIICNLILQIFNINIYVYIYEGHAHNRPQGPKGVPDFLDVLHYEPHAPAAFTLRGNPWYSFIEAESTPGHMVPSVVKEKIPSVTPPGIYPETVRLVAQCLKYYATPRPPCMCIYIYIYIYICVCVCRRAWILQSYLHASVQVVLFSPQKSRSLPGDKCYRKRI
jgi:hypothetical protein